MLCQRQQCLIDMMLLHEGVVARSGDINKGCTAASDRLVRVSVPPEIDLGLYAIQVVQKGFETGRERLLGPCERKVFR